MRTAWVVSEGSPGHDSQSNGLAEALATRGEIQPWSILGRLTAGGWARPLIRGWMGRRGRPLPPWLLRRVAETRIPAEAPPPELIIASGGKAVPVARSLAATHGAALVYLGEQKRYPNRWFDLIVSPIAGDPRPSAIAVELLPTPMSPARVAAAAAELDPPAGEVWAMVIGGGSRSHRFTDADWSALAAAMNKLAHRHGVRWLVTTSRRTGVRAEARLRDGLEPAVIADAVWWSEAPRRLLHGWLGLAAVAFVTQDSVTMVSEAVASGRPVVALRPADTRLATDSFLPGFFDRLEARRRIRRARVDGLAELAIDPADFDPLTAAPIDAVAEEVARRLGWPRPDASATPIQPDSGSKPKPPPGAPAEPTPEPNP